METTTNRSPTRFYSLDRDDESVLLQLVELGFADGWSEELHEGVLVHGVVRHVLGKGAFPGRCLGGLLLGGHVTMLAR